MSHRTKGMIPMRQSQSLVQPQIILLKLSGVWPEVKGQKEHKTWLHIVYRIYVILMMLITCFYTVERVKATWEKGIGNTIADIIFVFYTGSALVIKFSIIHIALYKYRNLLKSAFKLHPQSGDKKYLFWLSFLATVFQEGITLCYAYFYTKRIFSNLQFGVDLNIAVTFTGTATEVYIFLAAELTIFLFGTQNIVTALILGHCLEISRKLGEVRANLKNATKNGEIYSEEGKQIHLSKTQYIDICDISSVLDQVFGGYMILTTIAVSVGLFSTIYLRPTFTCLFGDHSVYYLLLVQNFLAFFYLCLGGSLMHSEVSWCDVGSDTESRCCLCTIL